MTTAKVVYSDDSGQIYDHPYLEMAGSSGGSLQRVDDPEWAPTEQLSLQPGREYYIRVDAYLNDSQSLRSEHIPFTVKD